jgi:hypothetical protein
MTGGPHDMPGGPRPGTVRVLGVLLILEMATFAGLVVLASLTAVIGYAARNQGGGFGDIAAVLSSVVAVIGVVLGVLTFLAWRALRSRRRATVALTIAVHVVPVVGLLLVRSSIGTLLGLTWAWAAVAVLGVGLVLAPPTRAWLTALSPPSTPPTSDQQESA